MVIEPKKNFIAYRCPACGQAVLGIAGQFMLSSDMLKLKCPCGETHMTSSETPDKKVRLSVPCLFCGKDHHYVLSKELFFDKEQFLLNCAYTGYDIGFLGDREHVSAAILENEKELAKLLSDLEIDSPEEWYQKNKASESTLPDAQVYDIVRFVVKELEADSAIDCPCHSGHYDFEILDSGIRVYCPDCGAEYIVPASGVTEAQEFLENCSRLDLR